MAMRLNQLILHGELDNTEKGLTRARIWLAGKTSPVELSLSGDCLRDLAGHKIYFTNRNPQLTAFTDQEIQAVAKSISTQQTGVVGDITASRRVEVSTLDRHETKEYIELGLPIPSSWSNQLYIEWFSNENGRVVIEGMNWHIRLGNSGQPAWTMDEDEELIQTLLNMQTMRDFITGLMGDEPTKPTREQILNEVADKYAGDPEISRKQAYVLGWDKLTPQYLPVMDEGLQLVEGAEFSIDDELVESMDRETVVLDLCFELKLFAEGIHHQILGVQYALEQIGHPKDTLLKLVQSQQTVIDIIDRTSLTFEEATTPFEQKVTALTHHLKLVLQALNNMQAAWLGLENNLGELERSLGPIEDIFEASFELREEVLSAKEECSLL